MILQAMPAALSKLNTFCDRKEEAARPVHELHSTVSYLRESSPKRRLRGIESRSRLEKAYFPRPLSVARFPTPYPWRPRYAASPQIHPRTNSGKPCSWILPSSRDVRAVARQG